MADEGDVALCLGRILPSSGQSNTGIGLISTGPHDLGAGRIWSHRQPRREGSRHEPIERPANPTMDLPFRFHRYSLPVLSIGTFWAASQPLTPVSYPRWV